MRQLYWTRCTFYEQSRQPKNADEELLTLLHRRKATRDIAVAVPAQFTPI